MRKSAGTVPISGSPSQGCNVIGFDATLGEGLD
jgi:hypothetical protein